MERCAKFPSMPVEFCWHCQNPTLISPDDPRYSIQEGDLWHGFPVIEVRKNGGPVHRFDRHFRFGRRKAEIVVACLDVLRDFGWATDDERLAFERRMVVNEAFGLRVLVSVDPYHSFTRSDGRVVERQWLYLDEVDSEVVHIGLGVAKARAVWSVRREISDWARRQQGPHRWTEPDLEFSLGLLPGFVVGNGMQSATPAP